jgi:hypothetical protein
MIDKTIRLIKVERVDDIPVLFVNDDLKLTHFFEGAMI